MLESKLDSEIGRRILDNYSRKIYVDFMHLRESRRIYKKPEERREKEREEEKEEEKEEKERSKEVQPIMINMERLAPTIDIAPEVASEEAS